MMMPNSFIKRIKKFAFQNHITVEEVERIIEALNKQRPMPRIEPEDKFYLWACPNCKTDFIKDQKDKYCTECGQMLERGNDD